MKCRVFITVLTVFCSLFCCFALPFNAKRALGELRVQHQAAEAKYLEYKNGQAGSKSQERRTALRLGEFKESAKRLLNQDELNIPVSVVGPSRMWEPRQRGSFAVVDSALQFDCGPEGVVAPSNGEYTEETEDFSFSERGGLSFSFTRRYSSFSEFDCGFGKGWDHNFNAGIIFDADDAGNAQRGVMFWKGREILFQKHKGVWLPESGHFLSLAIKDDKIYVLTPKLFRIEFEQSSEKLQGVSRWRLSAIATRHDSWKANRIELNYLENCDRLKSVVGVRGEKIDFSYDEVGHIVGIKSLRKTVCYEYNHGYLVKVVQPPVLLSVQSAKKCNPIVSYEYENTGGCKRLSRKCLSGQSYSLEISYDAKGRVVRCGYVADDASQIWQFTYRPGETVVDMPKPSAITHYFWGGTPHPSLPSRIEIPAQGAVGHYVYNSDFLPTEMTDALGVKTVLEYDAKNSNPLMRGNVLRERVLAGRGCSIKWREFGVRTFYEEEVSLPNKIISYQIQTNGVEEVVKRETFKYRRSDYSLIEKRETGGADGGGIISRFVSNRYGEIGIEYDANDNVTIYEYADSLPTQVDFELKKGSVNGGGLLVRKIEDATESQVKKAFKAMNKTFLRNEVARVKPCAIETYYAWDCDGNQIRVKSGHSEQMTLYNEKGAALVEFDNGSGLSVTEYRPDGRAESVFNEFCPDEHADYKGRQIIFFDGRYRETSFKYDSLGQVCERRVSGEKIGGVVPIDKFVRYSNGKIKQIINPCGVTRVDFYDPKTGWMTAQCVKGKSGEVSLGRIFERFADGNVRVYEDKLGTVLTNKLDSFGRQYETISCQGTVRRELKDSLDRIIETCTHDSNKIYSLSQNTYSRNNGLVESERKWKSNDGKTGEWIETQRCLYDDAGNLVGERSVHKDSWSWYLVDGRGRRVATMNPVGDYSITIYDADAEGYSYSLGKDRKDNGFMQGRFNVLDNAGRVLEIIPVDADGKLVLSRRIINKYNLIGQVTNTDSMGLSAKERKYNSLGWVVKEISIPLNGSQGERPIVVSTTYRADGKTVKRELENTALILYGRKEDVRPNCLETVQRTSYFYDEFGRMQKTENPDGLIVESVFNKNSLPSEMVWTHCSTTNVLRKIKFSYSPLGRICKLADGKSDTILQEFIYDGDGALIKAIDWNGGERVVLESIYDTYGKTIEIRSALSDLVFPARRIDYNPVEGVNHSLWTTPMSGVFWGKETIRTDKAGRLQSVTLDDNHKPVVEWEYIGQRLKRRVVKPSSINTEYEYTSTGDLKHIRMFDSNDFVRSDIGCLEYAYGDQGQMLFSSVRLEPVDGFDKYDFTTYSRFDDFRRLTGQNVEHHAQNIDHWTNGWRRVFGISERSLSNQSTLRIRYDQANNIFIKYQGEEFNGDVDEFNKDHSPMFVSSAKPVPDGIIPNIRELASNRETSRAVYDKADRLSAELKEYDLLGNLIEFKGAYWNGKRKIPVKWKLEYDVLGRLSRMESRSEDDSEYPIVPKGELIGVLNFVYDARNRRVMKRVFDYIGEGTFTNITYTVYNGQKQSLVYEKDGNRLDLVEEYLWGVGERELVMAAMAHGEKGTDSRPNRYWFQQDHGFNTILVTKVDNARRIPVSVSSYIGFGENATMSRIQGVKSSMGGSNETSAYDNRKDDLLSAKWNPGMMQQQFIELKVDTVRSLSMMTLWGVKGFPRDFFVYVLPEEADSPNKDVFDFYKWHRANKDYLACVVKDGYCQGYQKLDSFYSPYKVFLGGLRGNRIVIAWDWDLAGELLEIKEIEIVCTPDNPSSVAFAGQWLDRETDMYYQINRYRIAGSDKFISPDPLGFVAGNNLYAYANGNPLEWHDPDGRVPTLLIQAGIGALIGGVFGGGGYALQCWIAGEEFSWSKFAIETAIGAASGAIAGVTMGAFNPWAGKASESIAQAAWRGAARGAVSGVASGAFSGAAKPITYGIINGDDGWNITKDALKGSVIGGLSGAAIGAAFGAGAGAYAQWRLQRVEDGAVYRLCRSDETPSKGLVPKDTTANKTVNSHVTAGSRSGYKSQYISTTKDYAKAYKWSQKNPGGRIVKIYTSKLSNRMYDLTDPTVSDQYLSGKPAKDFAKGMQEVVIEGPIKPDVIVEAKFLSFEF